MPDVPQDPLNPHEPARLSGALTLRRRLEGAALGVICGSAAGWLSTLIGDVRGAPRWWVVVGLSALAAALGHRYGRSVVAAILTAFSEASIGR